MARPAASIRVAMDMTLLDGRIGGTVVYAESLLNALKQRDDVEMEVISAPALGGLHTLRWIATGARARIRQTGVRLLHCPAFLAPLKSSVPTVLTIHDLSLGRMPSGHPFEWRMYYGLVLPRLIRSAAAILTPTETVRSEVLDAFGLPPERVVATPLGVDKRFFDQVNKDRSTVPQQPLIVFPGPPIGRKNLDLLLRVLAAAPAARVLSRARLEITGAQGHDFPRYQRWISEHGLQERVRWLGELAFTDVPAVYARADVVAYPSFIEGFGLPPLEAMAVGTPVVASNASCLPEVLGDAAMLIDPRDDESFAEAIESVMSDAGLREQLSTRGGTRARSFTWDRCASLTAEVYRRVAGS